MVREIVWFEVGIMILQLFGKTAVIYTDLCEHISLNSRKIIVSKSKSEFGLKINVGEHMIFRQFFGKFPHLSSAKSTLRVSHKSMC